MKHIIAYYCFTYYVCIVCRNKYASIHSEDCAFLDRWWVCAKNTVSSHTSHVWFRPLLWCINHTERERCLTYTIHLCETYSHPFRHNTTRSNTITSWGHLLDNIQVLNAEHRAQNHGDLVSCVHSIVWGWGLFMFWMVLTGVKCSRFWLTERWRSNPTHTCCTML